MKIGIDVGGTHTDAVLIDDSLSLINKIKVKNNDIENSIITSIESLIDKGKYYKDNIEISISTTLVTNAISKNELERAGVFLIPGFDPLSFLYSSIPYIYKSSSGYIDHRGQIINRVSSNDLENALKYFKDNNIKNIGVISKFSTRNPELEKEAALFFKRNGFNVIEGNSLSGKLDFPRRVMTTYLSCGVYSIYQNVIKKIEKSIKNILPNSKINILKADGGSIPISEAIKKPIDTILSGPAASMMGFIFHLRSTYDDIIVMDVGGTTTDVGFFINGSPVIQREGISIGNIKTLVRGLKIFSLPIGGDSFFVVGEDGNISINNKRLGLPYFFGGPKPTITDLSLFLDNNNSVLSAFQKEGFNKDDLYKLECIVVDFLRERIKKGIELVNTKHIYTIEEFFEKRVFNPKKIVVVGGGAPYFKRFLEKTGYEVIILENYEVCNAIGAALARPSYELTLFANTLDSRLSIPEIDYYEEIDYYFNENKAKELVINKLKELASFEPEIVEEESFNMVRGFNRIGKNIRIVGQIKPGLLL
ncbi:MAG TPA: hydantoinase/oxoprolinase family protein [Spirochaetota bacterium]|nr:hydantoinase/oxoprolinase family protein [Spirochaetota bacterium]HOM38645.1 hydantoinase/oxoprolinase family protein [Spirochaetota bacterium]HPQ49839.1 hydantoinase/oxoprolinase family protein [Spirochaetota bacterium]